MTITRDVVIDLLPLYAAGEASPDSRAVVEEFMRQDASLTGLLRALQVASEPAGYATADPSAALEREALNRTRAVIQRRSWTLGLAIFLTLLPLSFVVSDSTLTFFLLRDEPGLAVLGWLSAAGMWWQYFRLTRTLKTAGL